jgi:hypothetical protein
LCPHCSTKRDANYAEKTEIEDTVKKIKDANPSIDIDFDGKIPQIV